MNTSNLRKKSNARPKKAKRAKKDNSSKETKKRDGKATTKKKFHAKAKKEDKNTNSNEMQKKISQNSVVNDSGNKDVSISSKFMEKKSNPGSGSAKFNDKANTNKNPKNAASRRAKIDNRNAEKEDKAQKDQTANKIQSTCKTRRIKKEVNENGRKGKKSTKIKVANKQHCQASKKSKVHHKKEKKKSNRMKTTESNTRNEKLGDEATKGKNAKCAKGRAKVKAKKGRRFKDCSTFLVPIVNFELIYPHTNAFRTRMMKTERRCAGRIRTSISRENRSGFLASKHKRAGSRKANRKDGNMQTKEYINMSKHATQRYRERGPNTYPVIKVGDGDSLATVVTLIPIEADNKTKRYKSAKDTKRCLLPLLQHGRNMSKESSFARVPKQIQWIFSISKKIVRETEVQRRKQQRRIAFVKRAPFL